MRVFSYNGHIWKASQGFRLTVFEYKLHQDIELFVQLVKFVITTIIECTFCKMLYKGNQLLEICIVDMYSFYMKTRSPDRRVNAGLRP